jgi:predicted Zn-dependent protease
MGNSASAVITPAEEREYAKALLRQMRAYEVLVEDPQIAAFFEDMGFSLVAHSDRPDKAFTFVVLDEGNINAFAAPGGVIALHSGLILAAESQDEVAGVLSHEIAHVTQLHLFRAFESAQRMTIPMALMMLGLILAGGGSGQAIEGALVSASAMSQQAMINFTRQNESEADRIGIQTLSLAGYDPQGMAGFFSKLGRLTRANGEGPPEYLRTHPVSTNRIAEAGDRARNLPKPPASDGRDFFLMQARVRALLADSPDEAIEEFNFILEQETTDARRDAQHYGMSIALQRKSQYQASEKLLRELLEEDPVNITYQLQLADLYLDSGREDKALASMKKLYHSFPGNHAIAVQYSNALLNSKDPTQAEMASVILRQQLLTHGDDPSLYALYARAANLSGNEIRATEAIAESYYQRGGIHEAVLQLERLARRDDLDYYQRARVSARLTEMRIQLGELNQDRERERDRERDARRG